MTVKDIMSRLNCSEFYALKMIDWANGDEYELRCLVAQKDFEKQSRSAIEIYK